MQCPKCRLENPANTRWCDCGYDFFTGRVEEAHKLGKFEIEQRGKSGRGNGCLWFLAIGIVALGASVLLTVMDARQGRSSEPYHTEAVYNDGWDGSVQQVKDYLKGNLKDPDSLQFIEWGKS